MLQESMDAHAALSDGRFGFGDVAAVGGLGMAALGAFLDPAGALVGAALGPLLDWVAANVSFVKEPLDLLLGAPDEIMAYSQAWTQTATQLAEAAQQHASAVQSDITQWTGAAFETFVQVQMNLYNTVLSSANIAKAMAGAVQVAGTIVSVLRELIWGMVKELVISLVTNAVIAAAAAIPSVGASLATYTAWAAGKVSWVMGKITAGISKVFAKLSKLTAKIGPLSRMFAKAAEAFSKMSAKFMNAAGAIPPRGPDGPDTPRADAPEPLGPPFGDPQPIHDPGQPLSSADHPFLASKHDAVEPGAVPTPGPDVTPAARPEIPDGWPDPSGELGNFSDTPVAETWRAGETRYRYAGDGSYPAGDYWTTQPPGTESGFRGDLAVFNEWNGDNGVVGYTPSEDIPVWTGPVGPQRHESGDYHLPGGGSQTWVDRTRFPQSDLQPGSGRWQVQSTPWAQGGGD